MDTQIIKGKIRDFRNCLFGIDKQRKLPVSEYEDRKLIEEQIIINQEISKLEWMLMTSHQKQLHRKAVINMAKKWGSMKGAISFEEGESILKKITNIYDLVDDILKMDSVPVRISKLLEKLIEEIDKEML